MPQRCIDEERVRHVLSPLDADARDVAPAPMVPVRPVERESHRLGLEPVEYAALGDAVHLGVRGDLHEPRARSDGDVAADWDFAELVVGDRDDPLKRVVPRVVGLFVREDVSPPVAGEIVDCRAGTLDAVTRLRTLHDFARLLTVGGRVHRLGVPRLRVHH